MSEASTVKKAPPKKDRQRFAQLNPLGLFLIVLACLQASPAYADDFPEGFELVEIFSNLQSPAGFAFSPDGRMFICERINGRLLVAIYNNSSDTWELEPEPFYTFDIPKENGEPSRHRSSGLRDIAFDPDFEVNGYVYAFYMKDDPRQNRVVRIKTSTADPNLAEPGSEELLLEVPYNTSASSGSHNGGAIEFGPDGMLYITTGDGWNEGDIVQSLNTYTGKVLRIEPDGSIPTDNPFYNETTGNYRAIYALGLRNPYTMSRHPESQQLYINEAGGANKASIFTLEAGANYGHQGYAGLGTEASEWSNGGSAGGDLITGGAWYPQDGYWPVEYHDVYFTTLWGTNSSATGHINFVRGVNDPAVLSFGTEVGQSDLKPVLTRVGPDGNLYYVLTNYERDDGRVYMLQWTGQATAASPDISPNGGSFQNPVEVTLSTSTPDALMRYTQDGSTPTEASTLYAGPFTVSATSIVNARTFKDGLNPSGTRSAIFTIGDATNIPPIADAGDDFEAQVGAFVTLNGAGSSDPDGDDLTLSWQWLQVAGPEVELFSDEDAVAFFTPHQEGEYQFQLTVSDAEDSATDDVRTLVLAEPGIDVGLIGHWLLNESTGTIASDAAGSNDGHLEGPIWVPQGGLAAGALAFDGVDDYVDIGELDLAGQGALTLAFWFNADDFDVSDARFVSKATDVNDEDHYWMVSTIGEEALRFRLKAGGTTSTLISPAGAVESGTWYHIAATYDGNWMRLYKDAVEIASLNKTGLIDGASGVAAAFGNQPVGAGDRPFDGLLDEIRIYNRALSPNSLALLADKNNPLPVELMTFEAVHSHGEITLSWTTASELNNAGFEVQKLTDRGFESLGWVDGQGTTHEAQTYSFTIPHTTPGRHVFRLKQVDFDGSFDFSRVAEITVDVLEQFFFSEIYPNPFNPAATFNLSVGRDQHIEIGLYDIQGRLVSLVHQGDFTAATPRQFEISGEGLASGNYMLRVKGDSFVVTRVVTFLK